MFFFLRMGNTRCRFIKQWKTTFSEQATVVICPSFISSLLSHLSLLVGLPFYTFMDSFTVILILSFLSY